MIVYLDTSIVLRVLFHEKDPLPVWGKWKKAYASNLLKTEAMRTIDGLRLSGKVTDEEVASLINDISIIYETLFIMPLDESILKRAGESFPTMVGTLDAIHLSTALAIREIEPIDLFLTHDEQLAIPAKSLEFVVRGVQS